MASVIDIIGIFLLAIVVLYVLVIAFLMVRSAMMNGEEIRRLDAEIAELKRRLGR